MIVDQFDSIQNLEILLDTLEERDTVIIYDLQPIVMKMNDLERIIKIFKELSIQLIVYKDGVDTHQEKYATFYDVLDCYISSRRQVYSLTNKVILQKRREKGLVNGRPVIDENVVEKINYLRQSKKLKYREIADECDVSIGTVCKYLDRGD